MMDFQAVLEERRSVRAYTRQPVEKEFISRLLQWAYQAPAAGGLRPWEFFALKDPKVRHAAVDTTFCGNQSHQQNTQEWLLQAPILFAVWGSCKPIADRYGGSGISVQALLYQGCGAAIENFLLGAVALGLSSCYVTGFREEALRQALHLPPDIQPIALLPLGYAVQPE